MLLNGDSDSETKLTINKDYAKRYDTWRQKEEFEKLKARYGENELQDSDDSSSLEDENTEQLTHQFEKDFFKTLSRLKQKDPSIYNEDVTFFSETSTPQKQTHFKKEKKPMFIRDYERKLVVEQLDEQKERRSVSPTIAEEEKQIKESLKAALKDDDDDADDQQWGGLLKKRVKTEQEKEQEEEEYRVWLRGQKQQLDDKKTESELKFLHDYWNDPNLNSSEKFLRDYILNRRFLEENNEDYIPTYEEVVHDSDEDLSEDEKMIEKQAEFEHKYNFRFEEPDREFTKRYPRTMENSLRRKDERRKRNRQEVKDRKAAEKAKKKEELKRFKALKRKEIVEKIETLKQITGNKQVGFEDRDLQEDFDPEKHDKRMRQLFGSEYYEEQEGEKPEFPELDEELELEKWDSWDRRLEHTPHCEDPDFNMDCDYDPRSQLHKELKGKRGKSKFAEVVAQEKPVFDSNNQTFDEYLDEYYKLDFEDLIGDLPCRFKYRKVTPNNFGLSLDEILQADDKELNAWCSLKRTVKLRPEHVEKYDVQAYEKKARNWQLKQKIMPSLYNREEEEDGKKKKKKKKKSAAEESSEQSTSGGKKRKRLADEEVNLPIHTSRKHKYEEAPVKSKTQKWNRKSDEVDVGISDVRLRAYGINPRKYKNKLKYGNMA